MTPNPKVATLTATEPPTRSSSPVASSCTNEPGGRAHPVLTVEQRRTGIPHTGDVEVGAVPEEDERSQGHHEDDGQVMRPCQPRRDAIRRARRGARGALEHVGDHSVPHVCSTTVRSDSPCNASRYGPRELGIGPVPDPARVFVDVHGRGAPAVPAAQHGAGGVHAHAPDHHGPCGHGHGCVGGARSVRPRPPHHPQHRHREVHEHREDIGPHAGAVGRTAGRAVAGDHHPVPADDHDQGGVERGPTVLRSLITTPAAAKSTIGL